MQASMSAHDQRAYLHKRIAEPIPAALVASPRFQGVVDAYDPVEGLTGWCVASDAPQTPVELELLIDGLAVARTRTGLRRSDVCASTGLEGDFGFQFEPEIFDRFSAHRDVLAQKRAEVRIAASRLALPQNEEETRLGAIFARREAYAGIDDAQGVCNRLQALQEASAPLLLAPYRPSQAPGSGCIERLAPGANGVLWFIGWGRRDHAREFAAAILDRRKYRAGAIVAGFERDDLGPEHIGFVGALRTDWRPTPSREAVVLAEGDGDAWRALRTMRLARVAEAIAHLERALAGEDAAFAQQLLAFARSNEGAEGAAAASQIRLAVDSAAMLEGFGIFMKGWIYSPTHAVKRLYLKLGDRQYEAEPQSLVFQPRPDLLGGFPAGREAVNRAGFCCVFETEGLRSSLTEIGLRVVLDDNSASSHSLPDLVVRRLSPDEDGGQFKEFYPHMERQALFAAYARAYYAQCETLYGRCRIEAPAPAPIQLVFAAPKERHRLYLMFEELRHNLRRCSARGVGVLILAGSDSCNGEIHELFHTLRSDFSGPCSLGFVEDTRFALWSLDCALVALGARRFVFVGAQALLDENGWEAVAGLLAAEPKFALLELANCCEPWSAPQASMHAFAWASEAFLDWRNRRRLPLGRPPSLAAEDGPVERRSGCGVIDPAPPPSATLEAINAFAGAR